jgi:hypothetical protein
LSLLLIDLVARLIPQLWSRVTGGLLLSTFVFDAFLQLGVPAFKFVLSLWRRTYERLQRQLAGHKLLIIDELGYVPLSQTGAELLFEVFSQRYERGATIVTSNLPFDEWTSVFGSERLTGALLDRLTHHVHILEMNGDSYRLAQSKRRSRRLQAGSSSEELPGR